MAKWRKTVNIKPLIGKDASDSGAQEAARNIRNLLQTKLMDELNYDHSLMDIVDAFEAVRTCEDFNQVLTGLYDWADDQRVWLGL